MPTAIGSRALSPTISLGEGTYYYSNGDRYVGPWRENKRQGPGVYFDAEGNAEQMEFRDGMRVS
jgi:hypothetical protein